jgi:hypothetical protein
MLTSSKRAKKKKKKVVITINSNTYCKNETPIWRERREEREREIADGRRGSVHRDCPLIY